MTFVAEEYKNSSSSYIFGEGSCLFRYVATNIQHESTVHATGQS